MKHLLHTILVLWLALAGCTPLIAPGEPAAALSDVSVETAVETRVATTPLSTTVATTATERITETAEVAATEEISNSEELAFADDGSVLRSDVAGKATLCGPWLFCLFTHKNYAGPKVSLKQGRYDLGATGLKNQASSYINNTGCQVYVSDYQSGPDPTSRFRPHTADNDLSTIGWNDTIDWVMVCAD